MISPEAIEIMEKTARIVGFGHRSDYPHLGKSPISAGDWKGDSIAACVFSDPGNARRYLDDCLATLDALGGGLSGEILTVEADSGAILQVAVITATDLVAESEIAE